MNDALRRVAIAAGHVALYCDRSEHAEEADVGWLQSSAEGLREAATGVSEALEIDLPTSYARRLGEVETKSPFRTTANFDGVREARAAATWRGLQEVQSWHDREYHPDVVGLARLDQVRHCALHVAKLCSWYARGASSEVAAKEIVDRRLADTLLFGLKLASLANVQLPQRAAAAANAHRGRGDLRSTAEQILRPLTPGFQGSGRTAPSTWGPQPPLLRPATGAPTTTSLQSSGVGSNESVRARPAGVPWRIGSGAGPLEPFGFGGWV